MLINESINVIPKDDERTKYLDTVASLNEETSHKSQDTVVQESSLNISEQAAYRHKHKDGQEFSAYSAEQAKKMCPFLGRQSLEEVELLLTLYELGGEIMAKEEKAKPEQQRNLNKENSKEHIQVKKDKEETPSLSTPHIETVKPVLESRLSEDESLLSKSKQELSPRPLIELSLPDLPTPIEPPNIRAVPQEELHRQSVEPLDTVLASSMPDDAIKLQIDQRINEALNVPIIETSSNNNVVNNRLIVDEEFTALPNLNILFDNTVTKEDYLEDKPLIYSIDDQESMVVNDKDIMLPRVLIVEEENDNALLEILANGMGEVTANDPLSVRRSEEGIVLVDEATLPNDSYDSEEEVVLIDESVQLSEINERDTDQTDLCSPAKLLCDILEDARLNQLSEILVMPDLSNSDYEPDNLDIKEDNLEAEEMVIFPASIIKIIDRLSAPVDESETNMARIITEIIIKAQSLPESVSESNDLNDEDFKAIESDLEVLVSNLYDVMGIDYSQLEVNLFVRILKENKFNPSELLVKLDIDLTKVGTREAKTSFQHFSNAFIDWQQQILMLIGKLSLLYA